MTAEDITAILEVIADTACIKTSDLARPETSQFKDNGVFKSVVPKDSELLAYVGNCRKCNGIAAKYCGGGHCIKCNKELDRRKHNRVGRNDNATAAEKEDGIIGTAKVYIIRSNATGKPIYVGATGQSMGNRIAVHRVASRTKLHMPIYAHLESIGGWSEVTIEVIWESPIHTDYTSDDALRIKHYMQVVEAVYIQDIGAKHALCNVNKNSRFTPSDVGKMLAEDADANVDSTEFIAELTKAVSAGQ